MPLGNLLFGRLISVMDRVINTYAPLGIGSGSLIAARYEIDIKLGAGATSAVYRARDKALNNSVCAIKIIDSKNLNSASDLERFRNEVVVTRKLTHPNIVRTFEYGKTESGQLFITMEYVAGKSLESLIVGSKEDGLISTAEIIFYLFSVAAGLESAHESKIIHRDLKPANILVSKDGEVKVTDFGLAKQKELDLKLTNDGECVGTPAYMSPEQLQGFEIDYRSDVYSFGILAYELITGELPFKGLDWFSLGKSIVTEPIPQIDSQKQKTPLWLCDFVTYCCNKNPKDRPKDFREIINILQGKHEQLEGKDHQARFVDEKVGRRLKRIAPNFPIFKIAPILLVACIAIFILMLAIEGGSKSAEEINQKVVTSEKKINTIVDNMSKAIYVLQKFEQKGDLIDKIFDKVTNEEAKQTSENTTAPAQQPAAAPADPQVENK